MNIEEFESKFPEFSTALVEALKEFDEAPEVSVTPLKGVSNVWLVQLIMNFDEDNYLIWVDGVTGNPVWWRIVR